MNRPEAEVSRCVGRLCPSAAGGDSPWPLLRVHRDSGIKLLCTHCLLRTHLPDFCSLCFSLFTAGGDAVVSCVSCRSLAHSSCFSNDEERKEFREVCPNCCNPERFSQLSDVGAAVFLAACKIAACSIRRAADVARDNAEKKVQEAAIARKLVLKMLGAPELMVVEEEMGPASGECGLNRADTEIPVAEESDVAEEKEEDADNKGKRKVDDRDGGNWKAEVAAMAKSYRTAAPAPVQVLSGSKKKPRTIAEMFANARKKAAAENRVLSP